MYTHFICAGASAIKLWIFVPSRALTTREQTHPHTHTHTPFRPFVRCRVSRFYGVYECALFFRRFSCGWVLRCAARTNMDVLTLAPVGESVPWRGADRAVMLHHRSHTHIHAYSAGIVVASPHKVTQRTQVRSFARWLLRRVLRRDGALCATRASSAKAHCSNICARVCVCSSVRN